MSHVDKIKHLGWYALAHGGQGRFDAATMRGYYQHLHYAPPGNMSQTVRQMAEKKPPDLLKDARGYRLERRLKEELDGKYAERAATVAIDAMLQALPGKVSGEAERVFLSEAMICFRNKAFRATIVMTWCLAYDHLLNWVLTSHLAAFNAAIPRKFPKHTKVIAKKEDFGDQFKEFEVIELCGTAGFLPGNIKKVLNDKLNKRNLAAHPSLVEIVQFQAEDVISDLVNNVILKLT